MQARYSYPCFSQLRDGRDKLLISSDDDDDVIEQLNLSLFFFFYFGYTEIRAVINLYARVYRPIKHTSGRERGGKMRDNY